MTEAKVIERAIIAGLVILALLSIFFGLSFLISTLFGLPFFLDLPMTMRVLGGAIVVVALAVTVWLFKYRHPIDMILSTYATFSKLFRRTSITECVGRGEPLILSGPQEYVRHPLYLGVTLVVFGWGLLTATTFVIVATLPILIWFRFVLIPFEERELIAIFGDQYKRYMETTPMLVPFTKSKKRVDTRI